MSPGSAPRGGCAPGRAAGPTCRSRPSASSSPTSSPTCSPARRMSRSCACPSRPMGLHAIPLWEELAVAVLPKDHPLADAEALTLDDLAGDPLAPAQPDTAMTVELVAAGTGHAILPHGVARLHHRRDVVAVPRHGCRADAHRARLARRARRRRHPGVRRRGAGTHGPQLARRGRRGGGSARPAKGGAKGAKGGTAAASKGGASGKGSAAKSGKSGAAKGGKGGAGAHGKGSKGGRPASARTGRAVRKRGGRGR